MCAIAGLFHPLDAAVPPGSVLRRMATLMQHRGPDGEGFHAEPHLGLAHRRLAIVDLAGGAQPMHSADGAVVVSFNGEIYNHEALRDELRAAGHIFQSRSDTEVLLAGWVEWGTGLVQRLDGMFAFALWDRGRGELFVARDRLGEKPLHYAMLPDGGLAFASELQALLAVRGVSHRLDRVAIDDFMALGYVPDTQGMHAGVSRLAPGHWLLLHRGRKLDAAGPQPNRYWAPPTRSGIGDVSPEALEARLDRAVRDRLMADVPLGSFLSGGVDSGAVTALAARAVPGIASFTIGFPGSADESALAAAVAARHGTAHHNQAGHADYLAAARGQAEIFGEPFGDHSSVPTLAVCTLARRHVTVALSGDGGDEVFAGYRRYRFHALSDAVRRHLPAGIRRRVLGGLAAAYPVMAGAPRWLRAKSTLTELSLDSALGYYRMVCKTQATRRRGLYSASMRAAVAGHDPSRRFVRLMAECDPDDAVLQAQYADLHTYLPGDILTKLDRTSMAVSLEVRPPLLAHPLVEWGMALPAGQKIRRGRGKWILRQSMRDLLPAEVLTGGKRGFAEAIGGQFRQRADEVRARLAGEAIQDSGLFDATALRRLADEHEAGHADHSQSLWQLLVMEGFLHGTRAKRATALVGA